jgi:hypothetical protein
MRMGLGPYFMTDRYAIAKSEGIVFKPFLRVRQAQRKLANIAEKIDALQDEAHEQLKVVGDVMKFKKAKG